MKNNNNFIAYTNFKNNLANVKSKNLDMLLQAVVIFANVKNLKEEYENIYSKLKEDFKGDGFASLKTNLTRNLRGGIGFIKYLKEKSITIDFKQEYSIVIENIKKVYNEEKLTVNKLYDYSKEKNKGKEENKENKGKEENKENNNISKDSDSFNEKLLLLIEEYESLNNLEKYDILSNACDMVYSKLSKEDKKKAV